jgi:ParB family transcriptional regulator, chromosome partitioning protein
VPLELLQEDPENPRTEFLAEELQELAADIAERGVLQPIVVAPPNGAGHYLIRFGAKRYRAARLAGLETVPVVVSRQPWDGYAQVAENLKRHGLTPLDLAKFMQRRAEAGDSNATIAQHLVIDLTTVAHHLALLRLPEPVDTVFREGRCTSPRTLYELAKLHEENPQRVAELLSEQGELTRRAVASVRQGRRTVRNGATKGPGDSEFDCERREAADAASWAQSACDRIEGVLVLLRQRSGQGDPSAVAQLKSLSQRLRSLLGVDEAEGSDCPTPRPSPAALAGYQAKSETSQ